MSDFFLSQLFGFIGLIFDSGAAQCKERNRMAAAMGVGAIFIAAHFALLGQVTAAAMFATAATRHFITIYFRSKFLYGVFVIMALVFVAFTYQGYLSLLSGIANILMVSGSFSQSPKSMRLLLIAGASVWLVHNIIIFSPVAILLELLFLISGCLGYYRHIYLRNKIH